MSVLYQNTSVYQGTFTNMSIKYIPKYSDSISSSFLMRTKCYLCGRKEKQKRIPRQYLVSPSDLPSDAQNHFIRPFYRPVLVIALSASIERITSKEKDLCQTQTLILNRESSDPTPSTALLTGDMPTLAFHHPVGDTHHVLSFTGRALPPDLLI